MPKQKTPHQTGGFPGQAPTSGNTQVEPTQKQFVNPEMEPLTGRDDNDDNAQQAVQQLQAQADEIDVLGLFSDKEKWEEFISCRKCKQKFDNDLYKPYLLPCLDAICESCTKNISSLEKQGFECNKCHCLHTCFQNGDLSLQQDKTRKLAIQILRLANDSSRLLCEMCSNIEKASHRCVNCYLFICAECVILHSTLKPLKSHTVLEIKGLITDENKWINLFNSTSFCPVKEHENEKLKMYCLKSSCMKPACVLCCIATHKDHEYCDITKVGKERKIKIGTLLDNVALKVNEAQKYVAELQNMNDKYNQISLKLQIEIKRMFTEAKKALEEREKKLCGNVAAYLSNKQGLIKNEKQKLTVFLHSCKHASYYINISPKMNDSLSFIGIAKSIQLQLENLKSQVTENQVSVDMMKFVVKPSDACFTTSINNYGKILATKVSAKDSKVIISPVCDFGKETQFQIQLFSSTGKPILDEKVCVYLKHDNKISKIIQCVNGKFSPCYIGIWIPDELRQLSWTIVSNGIELETLEGVIDVKATTNNDRKYSLARVKRETFQMSKQDASTAKKATERKFYPPVYEGENTVHSIFTIVNVSEKLQIKVYLGKITDIKADAIVCPQGENCLSKNDIARDIFSKIPDNRPINMEINCGDVWCQKLESNSNSKWKTIIHAVIPAYDCKNAKDVTKFGKTIKNMIKTMLKSADDELFHSIAIPLLGTGTEENKTPVDMCSYYFFNAVMAKKTELGYLNNIYLVLKDETIEEVYLEHFIYNNCEVNRRSATKTWN